MLHILIFGGTAAVFFAMTLSTLFHLRWARRLPSLPELLGGNESLPMNRPTPDPSQEGSKRSSASSQFPSWEGLGVGSWSQITASKSLRLSKNRNTGPRHGMFSASLLHRAVPAACPPVRRVSVVLAARDEEARIETTIRHLLAQQFVPVDVTVVDDRSKDRTSEILQRLANEDARLRVIRVDLLPEGWLGKCHACHLGAAAATGDWILFTDADCWLKPDVIARALLMAELDGVDHITLTPGVAPHTPAARAWHLAFLITLTDWISGVNRDKPGKYLGLGAFNLARTTAYRQCGGYEALRLTVLDDVKLGLLLRRAGKRTRAFIGGDDTECHWGATAGSMVQVMEKNYFAALEYRTLAAVGVTTFGTLLWGAALVGPFTRSPAGIAASLGLLSLILPAGILARRLGWSINAAALTPFIFPALFYAIFNSTVVTLRQGGVRWRETFYPLDTLRAGTVR